jgi:fumigallin biosynthesis monooxygenase-like protein
MAIFAGRHVARIEGDFVVFIIGMRINKPWKVGQWWPVFRSMPQMIKELEADPGSGFLGATRGLLTTGPTLVQYWRSFEQLERYARDPSAQHLPAWRGFNQRVRESGDVGIWHETYRVRAGEYEAIYGNMPRVGLATVGEHLPIGSTTATAAQRIGARSDDRSPVPGY